MTKVFLLQLEVDSEELKDKWANNSYVGNDMILAQGQAQYIEGMKIMIKDVFNYNA